MHKDDKLAQAINSLDDDQLVEALTQTKVHQARVDLILESIAVKTELYMHVKVTRKFDQRVRPLFTEYRVDHRQDNGFDVDIVPIIEPTPTPPVPAKPPAMVEGLFWLVLPRKLRDAIMGDAEEAYAQTIQRYNGLRWVATVDYIKEATFASLSAFRMSFAHWVALLWKRSS